MRSNTSQETIDLVRASAYTPPGWVWSEIRCTDSTGMQYLGVVLYVPYTGMRTCISNFEGLLEKTAAQYLTYLHGCTQHSWPDFGPDYHDATPEPADYAVPAAAPRRYLWDCERTIAEENRVLRAAQKLREWRASIDPYADIPDASPDDERRLNPLIASF